MEWKDVASWLWGVFLIPLGFLWKKADGAASKEDLERHRASTREDIRNLYSNAEADRKMVRDGFDKLSAEIHETHIALLNRIDGK